jgi:hypothetical protein
MAGFRLTPSSHNVNLWIVPLKMSLAAMVLFGITMDREDIEAAWQKTREQLASFNVHETVGLDITL